MRLFWEVTGATILGCGVWGAVVVWRGVSEFFRRTV